MTAHHPNSMDETTLAALKDSIKKWERNAAATTPDAYKTTPGSCPLCALFHNSGCEGCPVMAATGFTFCSDTPYEDADRALDRWRSDPEDEDLRSDAHASARDEAAFLRSLLPAADLRKGG